MTINARNTSVDNKEEIFRKKIAKRLDPTRPHEQELRRDATTTGQAPAEAGALISKDPEGESPWLSAKPMDARSLRVT